MYAALYEKFWTRKGFHMIILVSIFVTIYPFHEEYKLWRMSLCSFPRPACHPVYPSGPFGPLSDVFTDSLAVYQMSHTFRTFGTVIVLHDLPFSCSDGRRDDRRFWRERQHGLLSATSRMFNTFVTNSQTFCPAACQRVSSFQLNFTLFIPWIFLHTIFLRTNKIH